jgi:hypothetical protein
MCDLACCPDSGQLCVDAQFFVPSDVNSCKVNYLDLCPYLKKWNSELILPYQVATSTYSANLYLNDLGSKNDEVGKLSFEISVDQTKQKITVGEPNVVGYDKKLEKPYEDYPCVIDAIYFGNKFSLDLIADNHNSKKRYYWLKLAGVKIAILEMKYDYEYSGFNNGHSIDLKKPKLICYSKDTTQGDLTDVNDALDPSEPKIYPPRNKEASANPFYNSGSVTVDTEADPDKKNDTRAVSEDLINLVFFNGIGSNDVTQAMRIGDASLILQLRANKNVLSKSGDNADPDNFPPGVYDVCITYKPCDGDFENFHVFRVTITDNSISATWGKDTDKNGVSIKSIKDSAKLKKINVTVCGDIVGVFQNTNDFVMYIENVMQLTSLVGSQSIVKATAGDKPYSAGVLEFNGNDYKYIKAELANSKLYLAVKYVSVIPDDEKAQKQPIDCCPGTLNPFSNSNHVNPGFVNIKGFCMREITHMQDHPLHGSNLSREVTVCLSKAFIVSLQN